MPVSAAGMPAVAVTDQSNLFAMVKFYRAALAKGVKPVVGVDLLVKETGERVQPSKITLLCQSQPAMATSTRLVSRAYLEGQQRGTPNNRPRLADTRKSRRLDRAVLRGRRRHRRALTNGREKDAERALDFWAALFPGRFYIELQRVGPTRRGTLHRRRCGTRVPTQPAGRGDQPGLLPEAGRFRISRSACLHPRRRAPCGSGSRAPLFPATVPALAAGDGRVVRGRARGARQLGADRPPLQPGVETRRGPPAARIPCPVALRPKISFAAKPRTGLEKRLAIVAEALVPNYRERLRIELDVICQMGFAGYFLIVADFIRWARENGVPVGPGRGSGAGSLVPTASASLTSTR